MLTAVLIFVTACVLVGLPAAILRTAYRLRQERHEQEHASQRAKPDDRYVWVSDPNGRRGEMMIDWQATERRNKESARVGS